MAPARAKPSLSDADEARYSIRVTCRLTSISLDTLRKWEQRYGYPVPVRSSAGRRLYTDRQVDALRLITRALAAGFRPGEVVGRPRDELAALVRDAGGSASAASSAVDTIATILDLVRKNDHARVRTSLRRAALHHGPKAFVTELAHPLCEQVGAAWAAGRLAVRQEHLLSNCLSAQLAVLVSGFEESAGSSRVLLATFPGELHGLGLDMVSVYLAASHVTPISLGVDTPVAQIAAAAGEQRASAVGVLITDATDRRAAARCVRALSTQVARGVRIWVGGAGAGWLKDRSVVPIRTWTDLDAAIAQLTARSA